MPKFDDYTQKTTPEDTDIALILDKTANVNKKTPFSGIWTWIVNKMTNAVIQNLQTTNKTVIGSINELNSKSSKIAGISDKRNLSQFSFVLDINTDTHNSIILYGGTDVKEANNFFELIFVRTFTNTGPENVCVSKILPDSLGIQCAFDYNTKTLTISADNTVWGGVNIIYVRT